jgi:ABC-2 type transport system permease protein
VLLVGFAPRAAHLAWIVPLYGFLVGYLGQILQFPNWLNNLSPFGHIPQLPAKELTMTPLLVLTGIAVALAAAGLAAFRRREIIMT